MAVRAIGGTVAVTGQAGVVPWAFHKRCSVFAVGRHVPVLVLVFQRGPPRERIVCGAIRTVGAGHALPRVVVVVGVV